MTANKRAKVEISLITNILLSYYVRGVIYIVVLILDLQNTHQIDTAGSTIMFEKRDSKHIELIKRN